MAREITCWCDPCLLKEKRVPGTETEVAVCGAVARVLAFCPDCRERMLAPLLGLVETCGLPTGDGPRRAAGTAAAGVLCPLCDTALEGRTRMDYHIRHNHPFRSLADMLEGVCPICGKEFAGVAGLAQHQHDGRGGGAYGLYAVALAEDSPILRRMMARWRKAGR